jgi:hypothetical protein
MLIAVMGLFIAAFRYTRRISEQLNQPSGKPVTLRFFSDPKPLQAFTMLDLDGRANFDFRLAGKGRAREFLGNVVSPMPR